MLGDPARQMCARPSSRGTPIRPRRISVEQLSDEPWGRRRPRLRRLCRALRPADTRSLLALSPGNERMQAISPAVQQGARAYLNRQYTTIAGVGVVLFVALIFVQNIAVAVRLRDRRPAVGLDRLHRHERLGARQRARRRGRPRRRLAGAAASPSAAARSPACSSSGWRCSASPATTARSPRSSTTARRRPSTRSSGSASAAR